MRFLLALFILLFLVSPAFADRQAQKEATDIVNAIVGVCQSEGMVACERNFAGMDEFFRYVHLFESVARLDQSFKQFVAEKYGDGPKIDFYVLRASMNLTLDISFKPEQFTARMQDAEKVADGYLVTTTADEQMRLKRVDDHWVLMAPGFDAEKLKPLEPYYLANQLKRSILICRSMEADMAGLSERELLDNVGQDMAPLVLAVFGKEKFPKIVDYLSKDLDSVLKFYAQFSTREEMAAHIAKVHGLDSNKPPRDVRAALKKLLKTAPAGQSGGFVVFGGKSDLDYVQYALGPKGLILNWPTFQQGGRERLPLFVDYLKHHGYSEVSPAADQSSARRQIQSLPQGRYVVFDDGLYCQAGRDPEELRILTLGLLRTVFDIAEKDVRIQLNEGG